MVEATQAELAVMRIVWNQDKPTSRSVSDVLEQSKSWSISTTKTLLKRLVDKGYLDTVKEGNAYVYLPMVSEVETVAFHFEAVGHSFCEKKVGGAIASLIESYELSFEDREKILESIDNKEFVETVTCTCSSGCKCHQ